MKKRTKQCLLYALLIVCILLIAFRYHRLYLTPESAMAANEYGLHYGPSKEVVLVYPYDNGGKCLLVGKVNDRLLSVIDTEKVFGIFLRTDDLYGPFGFSEEEAADTLLHHSGLMFGITNLKEASYVVVTVKGEKEEVQFHLQVYDAGIYHVETDFEDTSEWFVTETAVYDRKDNLLYRKYLGEDSIFYTEYLKP